MIPSEHITIRIRSPFLAGELHTSPKRRARRTLFLCGVALLLVCASAATLFGFASRSRAEITLSPHTCLGGWKNPSNASGAPDVTDGDISKYSDANSASVLNTLADMFCGDFSGDIPKDTKPTAVTVRFSWALAPKVAPAEVSASVESLASSTSAVLDAAVGTIGTTGEGSTTTAPTEEQAPAAPAPDSTPEPVPAVTTPTSAAPVPIEEAAPQASLGDTIVSWLMPAHAHAQETATESVITITDVATSTTMLPANHSEDDALEVAYTLDGSVWHVLGTTASALVTTSFTLPLDQITGWDDLSKLQLRVRSLSGMPESYIAYVDSMTLEVSYADMARVAPGKFSLEDSAVFGSEKQPEAIVRSQYDDGSTNIIFYKAEGMSTSTYSYAAETVARGELPFSAYYAPLPDAGRYVMLEYKNDGGTFECNGITPDECMQDPHFVRRTDFQITDTSVQTPADATIATTTP